MNDLKKTLGLEMFPKVYFARVIGIGYPIYFVFFDSRRPGVTLTSVETHRHTFATAIPFKFEQRLSLTNILPIENFAGNDKALFIRVDISGRFQQFYRFSEKTETLVEEMNLKDFKSAAAVSAKVQQARKKRRKLLGNEIKNIKLENCIVDKEKDFVEFTFLSTVTPDGKKKFITNPSNNFELEPNPSGTYTIQLRMENFFTWLIDTQPDGKKFTPKELKDALEICPIKMWDNDPSMYWQGFAYNLSQLDASIYEVNIPPKQWNPIHGGDFFLSKHMTALVMNIDFLLNNMTSKLSKGLRQLGILDAGFTFKKGV